MADSNTPVYSLIQPEIDGADGTWGVSTNSNWLSVDNLLSGTSPLTALNVTGIVDTGGIKMDDGEFAQFGTGNDLKIWHSGTNSYIQDSGTGDLNIQTDGAAIKLFDDANSVNLAAFVTGGAAKLYWAGNNAEVRLSTTEAGLDVTNATGAAVLKVEGTYTGGSQWANAGVIEIGGADQAWLDLKAPNSDDYDVRLLHNRISNTSQLVVNNGSMSITTAQDSPIILSHQNSVKLATSSAGIDVTGTVTCDEALTISSTGAAADAKPDIFLYNNATAADGERLGQITYFGKNSAAETTNYGWHEVKTVDVTDGVEDSVMEFWVRNGAGNHNKSLTINKDGIDVTGTVDLDNLTISSAQGTAGQVLKSTGSGIEWGSGGAGGEETLAQTLAFGNSTGANDINVDSTQKIVFGGAAGGNLEISETAAGTALMRQIGSGDFVIRGFVGSLQNDAGNILLQWATNDVALYWRGTDAGRRLITTEAGVDVTGGVQADYIDLTGGESTTTTGTIACKQIIFDDLSTGGSDEASISTEANGATSTLRIRQADDANADRIILQAGAEDVLLVDSTGVKSSPMMELRSTSIVDQNLIPYFGKRLLNNATTVTTYAIPQVASTRVGQTVVICNPTDKTITLDADGGTGTIAQYVWILDGVTLSARNGDWQIKAGGVIELVQVGSDTAGGSQSAPNYVIFGAGILAV